jgi:amino acid permease
MAAIKERLSQIWGRHFSLVGTVLNFCGVLFGSGFVTTPLTNSQMGLLLGSLSMLGLGLVNAFTCTVMLEAAEQFGTPESYHDLTQSVLGAQWALFLDVSIVLAEFFACCQRLILMGDFGVALKHRLITNRFMPNRPLIVLLLAGVLGFPFVYTARIRALEKVSFVAILCTLTSFAVLIYTIVVTGVEEGLPVNDIVYANWSPDMLLALPVQEFAFAGQAGIIPVYREMRNRSLARGKLTVYIAFSICAFSYLTFGILGYLQYPGTLEADFFNLYEEKPGALYDALYFILILAMVGAFPLNVYIGRLHLGYLVLGRKRGEERKWGALFATVFVVGSIGVAVAIKNLAVAQGLGGGLGDSFVNFVVPGCALLKLMKEGGREQLGGKQEGQKEQPGSEDRQPSGRPASREFSDGRRANASGGIGRYRYTSEPGVGLKEGQPMTSPEGSDETSDAPSEESTDVQSTGQADEREEQADSDEGRHQRQSPAGDSASRQGGSRFSPLQIRINKLIAYGLFTLAAVIAGISTVGNLVSLCLVGWDNSGLTFYEALTTR